MSKHEMREAVETEEREADSEVDDPLMHQLHTEIDVSEAVRAHAKQAALAILDEKLEMALAIAEGDGTHGASRVTEAMQILAGWLGEELNEITAQALKQGAQLGAMRVAAAKRK